MQSVFFSKNFKSILTKSPAVARVGAVVLVVTDHEGHTRSMIFISSNIAYVTSY